MHLPSSRILAGLLLIGAALPSCEDALQEDDESPSAEASRPPHVVVMLVDTVRADRLSVYGYSKPTTPHLDALAEEAVVFEAAHSAAPWTLPSVVSLMLSSFVGEHGVIRDGHRIAPDARPLAVRLAEAGYRTGSFHRNPYAGELSGLDVGFETASLVDEEVDGEQVSRWLHAAESDRPFFLYLHNTGAHDPYDPPAKHLAPFGEVDRVTIDRITELCHEYRNLTRENIGALLSPEIADNSARQAELMRELDELQPVISTLYDGELRWTDALIGSVIESLKKEGIWDETLFIVLSDHGEELGEHAGWQHDQSVYEELVRVPLMVKLPGGTSAGRRIEAPVSLIDVMPTILDATGLPHTESVSGRTLLPWLRDAEEPSNDVRVTAMRLNRKKFFAPFKALRGDENIVLRQGGYKAIWNVDIDTFELYDLTADPLERRDLSGEQEIRVEKLKTFAKQWRQRTTIRRELGFDPTNPADLTPEQRRHLERLGYLKGK